MNVTCPKCGETGKVPKTLIGLRIKCKKCSTSFLVTPSDGPATAHPEKPGHAGDVIEVAGLDDSAWSAPGASGVGLNLSHDPAASAFTAFQVEPPPLAPAPLAAGAKQYKVLTPKDKWFENKFDLGRLEEALNHFAREGWVVRSMATPHITGFSGGDREVLVILLERPIDQENPGRV